MFSSKKPTKASKETQTEPVPEAKSTPPQEKKQQQKSLSKTFNYSAGCSNLMEFLNQNGKIEDVAVMEYKKFPVHLRHFDKNSPDYIESEYDDHTLAAQIHDYNEIIDNLKKDLEVYRKYQQEFEKIKSEPLDHLERGVTSNVFDEVKDYSGVPADHLKRQVKDEDVMFSLLDNLGMSINNTLFHEKWTKTSNEIEWEKQLDERPVNPHFNQLKGSKFDVEIPHHLRHKHVADRLGHPEIYPTPLETIMRLEQCTCHPGFLDQPFIQIPSAEPDAKLDLRPGEILYENPKAREWNKFFLYAYITAAGYFSLWMPYLLLIKSSTPSFKTREEFTIPYLDQNFFTYDTFQLSTPFAFVIVYLYFRMSLSLLNNSTKTWVTSIRYNQSKDLLFVKSVNQIGVVEENIHEIAHLEILPPHAKSLLKYFDFSKNGVTTVTNLNNGSTLNLHNGDSYWNMHLKNEFVDNLTTLWDKSYYEEGVGKREVSGGI